MNIEKLIHLHNERLNREVEDDVFLAQRIKARLKASRGPARAGLWNALYKQVLVYGMALLVFTLINFFLIDSIKPKEAPPVSPPLLSLNTMSPDYPGSINHAYARVMKTEAPR